MIMAGRPSHQQKLLGPTSAEATRPEATHSEVVASYDSVIRLSQMPLTTEGFVFLANQHVLVSIGAD